MKASGRVHETFCDAIRDLGLFMGGIVVFCEDR